MLALVMVGFLGGVPADCVAAGQSLSVTEALAETRAAMGVVASAEGVPDAGRVGLSSALFLWAFELEHIGDLVAFMAPTMDRETSLNAAMRLGRLAQRFKSGGPNDRLISAMLRLFLPNLRGKDAVAIGRVQSSYQRIETELMPCVKLLDEAMKRVEKKSGL